MKKATCPSNRESEMVNNCNIAYDIVRQHTTSYVSIRCSTSAYDVVRQHTMSYVSIRCRTSANDIAYDMQHVGDHMGAALGAGVSQRRACSLFWHGCSRFPKHVVLPFWTSFRVSKRTYSPGQTEHVISAQHARAQAGVHACMSRGGGARRRAYM